MIHNNGLLGLSKHLSLILKKKRKMPRVRMTGRKKEEKEKKTIIATTTYFFFSLFGKMHSRRVGVRLKSKKKKTNTICHR